MNNEKNKPKTNVNEYHAYTKKHIQHKHKWKTGIGAVYLRRKPVRPRVEALQSGGGQER